MSADEKFCRDCVFARRGFVARVFGYWGLARCAHPEFGIKRSARDDAERLVSGNRRAPRADDLFFCSTNRRFDCGPEGNGWSPIE